ncbi:MAG TPA: von Willebrand factor type A domain-containing protein [Myxococcota bacterium]|nr:von Willebrand factor type A domain-containing protein [Myxococcota bacterium]
MNRALLLSSVLTLTALAACTGGKQMSMEGEDLTDAVEETLEEPDNAEPIAEDLPSTGKDESRAIKYSERKTIDFESFEVGAELVQPEGVALHDRRTAGEESGGVAMDPEPDSVAMPIGGATKAGRKKSEPASRPSTTTAGPPPAPPKEIADASDDTLGWDGYRRQEDNTEDYVHYGVNDMTLSDKDRFSTFSIDVDTASFAISRRKLTEGWMPPTASVRVEEFVNAMDYDYDAPRAGTNDGAPFAVHMEAAPSPWQDNHHVLRVGVQGAEIDQDSRAPMHLTFLVDTSGSMNRTDKLGYAKESLKVLVNNLGEEDTVSLVTYAGSSQVILEPTSCTRKATIHAAIDSLSSGGGTHMDSGMNLAYQMASQSYLHGAENRVIVLSDGDANIGRTTHDEILATIQNHAEEGITLSTIGFGMGNYKDTMMEQLSNNGDGNYFYIDSLDEAHEVFGKDLAGTIQTIAKDVKIQVEFNPDAVTAYRLIGYENRDIADVDFRNDRVDAGEIGSGHAVTALYDVVLKDDAMSQELATVRIRAKKPGPDSAASEWATLMDGELLRADINDTSDDFRLALATASFAELLRGSPYLAEVSYSDVWALAKSADRGRDEDTELLGLIETAGALSGETGPVAGR